jgi:hypothetical protein
VRADFPAHQHVTAHLIQRSIGKSMSPLPMDFLMHHSGLPVQAATEDLKPGNVVDILPQIWRKILLDWEPNSHLEELAQVSTWQAGAWSSSQGLVHAVLPGAPCTSDGSVSCMFIKDLFLKRLATDLTNSWEQYLRAIEVSCVRCLPAQFAVSALSHCLAVHGWC